VTTQTITALPTLPPRASVLTGSYPIRVEWADGKLHEGWDRGQWSDAYAWTPECNVYSGTWPRCARATLIDGVTPFVEAPKQTSTPGRSGCAVPFWITVSEACDTMGPVTFEAHRERLDRVLANRVPWELARTLWTGQVNGATAWAVDNGQNCQTISLAGAAQTVANTDPAILVPTEYVGTTPNLGLADLLQAMDACKAAGPWTFHMPGWLQPFLCNDGCVTWSEQDRTYRAFGQHPIIFGPGYPGTPPASATLATPVSPGLAWVYVTGPVYRAVSEWTLYTGFGEPGEYGGPDLISAAQNIQEPRAEKLGVVMFDPCCVFATLIRYC
jgi:hypothetical protein